MAIRVRIGMSAGDVELDDGDYYGEPVVEAARLCALADPGSILVVELVRLLAGRTVAVTFQDPVPYDLKGLPDPVPACVVQWESVEVTQIPLLWPAGSDRPGRFVGRAPELGRFTPALDAVEQGQSRVVVLTGESGIGKSRTAEELALLSYERGALVLAGRAREELPGAVRSLPGHRWPTWWPTWTWACWSSTWQSTARSCSRLVPELGARIGPLPPLAQSDPETERYRLYRAVVGLLADAALRPPDRAGAGRPPRRRPVHPAARRGSWPARPSRACSSCAVVPGR